ncbi:MAG: hypothetical protein ACR2MT_03640 [Aurantibacter sp.]
MEFINHSLNWCKGEIFEGKMSLLFGVVVLLTSLAYLKWASTAYAKALFWPLLVVALVAMGAGVYLLTTNQKRVETFPTEFEQNPTEFIQTEKERTADFIKWYPITQKILFGLMIAGMLCMLLSKGALVRSIGIGLMLLSLYGFVLDHFSEERATTYDSHILNYLKK